MDDTSLAMVCVVARMDFTRDLKPDSPIDTRDAHAHAISAPGRDPAIVGVA